MSALGHASGRRTFSRSAGQLRSLARATTLSEAAMVAVRSASRLSSPWPGRSAFHLMNQRRYTPCCAARVHLLAHERRQAVRELFALGQRRRDGEQGRGEQALGADRADEVLERGREPERDGLRVRELSESARSRRSVATSGLLDDNDGSKSVVN